ncbi:hypothetical protein CMV_007198 [Castanea mollissima]|uniref:Uncharacterized protein n=1 Tax=Castanea mollissima TaxID=60419 RepID=A0A8J4RU29_9ROSI|nr:hypothetical protein CMV_007198 [Castanea mollissima]
MGLVGMLRQTLLLQIIKLGKVIFRQTLMLRNSKRKVASTLNTDEERELDEEYVNAIYVDVDLDSPDDHEKIGIFQCSKLRSETRLAMMKEKERCKKQEGDHHASLTSVHSASVLLGSVDYQPTNLISSYSAKWIRQLHFLLFNNLGAIDDNTYRLAVDKFVSADWREIFVSMSNARKKAWLDHLK